MAAQAIVVRHDPDPALWSPQELAHYRNYVGEVELTVELLQKLDVSDREKAKKVADGVAECKRLFAHIEMIRDGQVRPLNEQVSSYNNTWRPLTDALKKFEGEGKRKLLAFQQKEREEEARKAEAARKAQEEAARKEAEALAKLEAAKTAKQREKAEAAVQAASTQMLEARLAEPVPLAGGFRSEHGTTSSRWPWVHKVHDPALVPRQYLIVDDKAVRAALRDGVREIPGIHIYQEETLATRF